MQIYRLSYKFIDKYVSLRDRVNIANNFKVDYFLSIHINSCNNSIVRGVEVWQYSNSKNVDEIYIYLCEDISNVLSIKNRWVKYSKNLYVLKHTYMKAVLLEVDFISNSFYGKALCNDYIIKNIALVIKENILKLFK